MARQPNAEEPRAQLRRAAFHRPRSSTCQALSSESDDECRPGTTQSRNGEPLPASADPPILHCADSMQESGVSGFDPLGPGELPERQSTGRSRHRPESQFI